MSANGGAWGIAMWKDGRDGAQTEGISLEGGDAVIPFLPTDPLGCLTLPPEGLGVPPVRSGDVAFAQRDGVVQFGDYYEPRILTFQASICNDGCPGCDPATPTDTFLSLTGVSPGRARTADKTPLDIVGDLDVKVHANLTDWTPAANQTLIGKFNTTGNQRSWRLLVFTDGSLRLIWSADGTATVFTATSTAMPVVANGADLWVRASLDVNNGAGGRDIMFETSTDGVIWEQLGTTVTQAGVTSIFASTADLAVGAHTLGTGEPLNGRVYSAEVSKGRDGEVVANPNFDEQGLGTTQFTDGEGNLWTIVAPASIAGVAGAVPMSARQKVKRLTEEWSRNCDGATLAILSDCHDPDATQEQKTYLGPYLVHGRPRVADVRWLPSNVGCAEVTLRFDCEDAALRLAVSNDPDPLATPWSSGHTVDVDAGGSGGNMHPNYRLEGLTMTTNGGTFNDSHLSAGGPDGGSFFSRSTVVANTTSPMTMDTTPSGTGAIPVVAGQSYTLSWWAEKSVGGGPQTRVNMRWFDAGGATLSTTNGTNMNAGLTWSRFSDTFVAPVSAAFAMPILAWSGTALVGQVLDLAQIWMNEGVTATGPGEVEVVGDLCVFPIIHLFGELTAPIVVNYGPWQFEYNDDIGPLDNVTIDTRWGRANAITVDSTQFLSGNYTSPLSPGTWDFSITTADPTDDGSARIQWYNAVVSG